MKVKQIQIKLTTASWESNSLVSSWYLWAGALNQMSQVKSESVSWWFFAIVIKTNRQGFEKWEGSSCPQETTNRLSSLAQVPSFTVCDVMLPQIIRWNSHHRITVTYIPYSMWRYLFKDVDMPSSVRKLPPVQ